MIPKAILFFGLAGAGKTFVGRALAEKLGCCFFDLDSELTPAMLDAIRDGRPFTDEMRDEFFRIVSVRIRELVAEHERVIFAQGAYKERHRAFLRKEIPNLETIWVTAPVKVIGERLQRRSGGIAATYAADILKNFEPPATSLMLSNDGCSMDELFSRFMVLFTEPSA